MQRPSTRLPAAERAMLVTRVQIEQEMGWKPAQRARSQRRVPELWKYYVHHDRLGQPDTWDSQLIECLRAMYDQPHREVVEPGADWLSEWLSGGDK